MKRMLLIIGASGHGKVVADIAKNIGYESIAFLDDNKKIEQCGGFPVIGKLADISQYSAVDIFVAIGNADIRRRVHYELKQYGLEPVILVHPMAVVSTDVKIGAGTVVMAGAVINPDTKIGEGCIINTCSSVDHDCEIGDFVHVAVGSHLAGAVQIGERTWIGAGATVSNNLNICAGCMIGAGAVVVKNIEEQGCYVGVPAKRVEK